MKIDKFYHLSSTSSCFLIGLAHFSRPRIMIEENYCRRPIEFDLGPFPGPLVIVFVPLWSRTLSDPGHRSWLPQKKNNITLMASSVDIQEIDARATFGNRAKLR